jgi:hypothetical protein
VDFLAKTQNKYNHKGLRVPLNIQFKVKIQDALDKQWGKQALCIRTISLISVLKTATEIIKF